MTSPSRSPLLETRPKVAHINLPCVLAAAWPIVATYYEQKKPPKKGGKYRENKMTLESQQHPNPIKGSEQ